MGRLFARIVAAILLIAFFAACIAPFYYLWLLIKNSMEAAKLKHNLQSLSEDFLLCDTDKEEIVSLKQKQQAVAEEIKALERQGDASGVARNVDGSLSRRTEIGKSLAAEIAEQCNIKSKFESALAEHKNTVQERWNELQEAVSSLNVARRDANSAAWALTVWFLIIAIGYVFIKTCSIVLDSNANTLIINGQHVYPGSIALVGPYVLMVIALLLSLIPYSSSWKSIFKYTRLSEPTWNYYDAPKASEIFSASNIINGNRSFSAVILIFIFVIVVSRSSDFLEPYTWIAASILFVIQILFSVRLFRSNSAKAIAAIFLCILTVPLAAYLEIQGRALSHMPPTVGKEIADGGGNPAITNPVASSTPKASESFSDATFANRNAARAAAQNAGTLDASSTPRPVISENSAVARPTQSNDPSTKTSTSSGGTNSDKVIEVRAAIPTGSPVAPLPASELPAPAPELILYRVAGIQANDVLNMRAGPGSNFPLIVGIAPDAIGISAVGPSQMNGTTRWQNIRYKGFTGWVNADFLLMQSNNNASPAPAIPSRIPGDAQNRTDNKNMNQRDHRNIVPIAPNQNPTMSN